MSLPIRKEIILAEDVELDFEGSLQVKFDPDSENMVQWIIMNICNLAIHDNEKRIFGRMMEGLAMKANMLFSDHEYNEDSFKNLFDYLIGRLNLYPQVYLDLYDEIVTKEFFWNQFMEYIQITLNLNLDFHNPYENISDPIIVINDENDI